MSLFACIANGGPMVPRQSVSGGGAPLHYTPQRWMQFVDGENITIRAQQLLKENEIALVECDQYRPDTFICLAKGQADYAFGGRPSRGELDAVRSFYYTSLVGDDVALTTVRTQLWGHGFEAHVFKKEKSSQKTKGVDIALSKDMLSHAFRGNFDTAILVAGDSDYVPLVEEVKRLGKRVHVHFIKAVTSPELMLSADVFNDITKFIVDGGRAYFGQRPK
jgi:uncharacterized LabA/DUF88 family protein